MSRSKIGERLANKRDTPLKTRRRAKGQRFLPVQRYGMLPEEPEEDLVVGNIRPGHCRSSRLRGHRSALIEDPEDNPALATAPTSRNASPRMFPAAFRRIKLEPNLSVTSGSTTSQSLESDLTLSSDNDGDEDTCSSALSTSLPSPEIFRREISEEAPFFCLKEGAVLHNKNSTLLDASHALSIHMHPAPNLSKIADSSAFWPGNNLEIKHRGGSEPEVKIVSSIPSANKCVQSEITPKLTKRKPILLRKKVWFKSPLSESKHSPLPLHRDSEPSQSSSLPKHVKPESGASTSQVESEEAVQPQVRPRRSTTKSPEGPKFFDFSGESEMEAFFQRMRERRDKLWSIPLFPLTAGNCSS